MGNSKKSGSKEHSSQSENNSKPEDATPSENKFIKSVFKSLKEHALEWNLALLGLIFMFLWQLGVLDENRRCSNFPIAYEFIREHTCPQPTVGTLGQFDVVLARLAFQNANGDSVENNVYTNSVSESLRQSLATRPFPASFGSMNIIPYTDIWVDRITSRTNLDEYAENLARRFNADLVIYGIVTTNQAEQLIFQPCIFVREDPSYINLTEINLQTTCSLGQLELNEGSDVGDLSEWIVGIRAFSMGLQRLQLSEVTTNNESLVVLNETLEIFEEMANTPVDELSAIGHLYAGNTALEIALRNQVTFEQDCIAGRCQNYDSSVISGYQRGWDHYTAALQKLTVDDELRYRALIGRGNIHYRLARVARLTTDDLDEPIRYSCQEDDLLWASDETDQANEHLTWIQRARVAIKCYEQAANLAPANDEELVKIHFGRAQVLQWLAVEGNQPFSDSIDAYTEVINFSGILTFSAELNCVVGLAYGERAQSQWRLVNQEGGDLGNVRVDLTTAIQMLQDNSCMLDEDILRYQNDLASIPIP